tara:strand:- start:406 stop:1239 length:834 start_codon:yes stop_codon:yes gene_type:complete
MIKSYNSILCLVIILFTLLTPNHSQAAGRAFIELFEQIFKFLGKRGDDIPIDDAGKTLENFKGLNKSDELINSELNKTFTNKIEDLNLNKINEIKNSSDSNLLEVHGVKNADIISDAVEVAEVDISSLYEDKTAINAFRIFLWSGRIFRGYNSFNQPETDRVIMKCNDNREIFYFTALLEKRKKWLLLSHNATKNADFIEINKISKQNLLILKDTEDYIVFSTQTSSNMEFPLHYFIISNKGAFYHFNNVFGTESPKYIMTNAMKKISESNYFCNKI